MGDTNNNGRVDVLSPSTVFSYTRCLMPSLERGPLKTIKVFFQKAVLTYFYIIMSIQMSGLYKIN